MKLCLLSPTDLLLQAKSRIKLQIAKTQAATIYDKSSCEHTEMRGDLNMPIIALPAIEERWSFSEFFAIQKRG